MSSLETLFAQASDALRHKDAERARDLCAEARRQAPDDPRFVMLHGFALRRSGDHAAAEPLLRRTLSVDPGLEIGYQFEIEEPVGVDLIERFHCIGFDLKSIRNRPSSMHQFGSAACPNSPGLYASGG